ncbi:MAG: hypothetical protein AB7L66_14200 [Gemmatimonadales bacterium]
MTRSTMKLAILAALTLFGPRSLLAQAPAGGWRLGLSAGPCRVDRTAGTPFVPRLDVTRAGRQAVFTFAVSGIKGAGFYGLDALALDAGIGLRGGSPRFEVQGLIGPSGMLGGDGDGTPYLGFGANATLQGTAWLTSGVGITAGGVARSWFTTGNTRFSPSAYAGLRIRLSTDDRTGAGR